MNRMQRLRIGLLALVILGAAWGCGTQTSPGDIITGKVFPEMAVGTLNDSAGTISALNGGPGPGTYANVVTSFRNNLGASAFQNSGNGYLHFPSAPQLLVGGLFSYGQAPFVNGVVGNPPAYVPASAVGGYATGFIFTGQPATPGTYSWSAIVTVNGQNQPYGATATLPASPTVLPAQPAPTMYTSGGTSGGGTFTVVVPAGVTETLVVVACASVPAPTPPDPCFDFVHGVVNTGLDIASGEAKAGATTVTLPAGTLKKGDGYTAIAIGADYPLVEAGPPANAQPTPTLTGAGGTADLTVSGSFAFAQ